jgi:hypothetical protein
MWNAGSDRALASGAGTDGARLAAQKSGAAARDVYRDFVRTCEKRCPSVTRSLDEVGDKPLADPGQRPCRPTGQHP